jgi:hypothetical protein
VDLVRDGLDQSTEEVCGVAPRDRLAEFDKGELRGPVDGDEEIEFAFGGSNLGNIDVELSNRISLELPLRRRFPFNLGQPRDSTAPQAAMQGRAGQMRNRRLKRVEAVVERQKRMPRKAMITASSSTARTVDPASLGPVGRSETEVRFFHLATVLGLIPCRLASVLRLS